MYEKRCRYGYIVIRSMIMVAIALFRTNLYGHPTRPHEKIGLTFL